MGDPNSPSSSPNSGPEFNVRGHVTRINIDRGFGFIMHRGDVEKETFFHQNSLQAGIHIDQLRTGDPVTFNRIVSSDPKQLGKMEAENVRPESTEVRFRDFQTSTHAQANVRENDRWDDAPDRYSRQRRRKSRHSDSRGRSRNNGRNGRSRSGSRERRRNNHHINNDSRGRRRNGDRQRNAVRERSRNGRHGHSDSRDRRRDDRRRRSDSRGRQNGSRDRSESNRRDRRRRRDRSRSRRRRR